MSHALLQLLSLAGFAALALATDRAGRDVLATRLTRPAARSLRLAGWAALALALAAAVHAEGWARGLVAYSGHTSLAAGLVFLLLVVNGRVKSSR